MSSGTPWLSMDTGTTAGVSSVEEDKCCKKMSGGDARRYIIVLFVVVDTLYNACRFY